MKEMKILKDTIEVSSDYLHIEKLKFLKDNPRVYSCTHGEAGFNDLPVGKQQEIIYQKLCEEPSVKTLVRDIKRHGGLMEPILVRFDTLQVIEGNSRLAAYRLLHVKYPEDEWDLIPCDIVSSLTDEAQAAFLSQIHVKGKTKWAAYEKANFAFVRHKGGWNLKKISKLFGESEQTIRFRIKTIELMKENEDTERSHFSYYDVLVRKAEISKEINKEGDLKNRVLEDIRNLGVCDSEEDDSKFTAQEMRKQLPLILKKPKVLKKYISGELDLFEAYERARISKVEEKVKQAHGILADISLSDVKWLPISELNALKQAVRKLSKETKRVENIMAHGDVS